MQQLATSIIEPFDPNSREVDEWVERFEETLSIQPAIVAETDAEKKDKLKV